MAKTSTKIITIVSDGHVESLDLNDKADVKNVYTKNEINNFIANGTMGGGIGGDIIDHSIYYTKDEVNDALDDKADKVSTYTKSDIDTKLKNIKPSLDESDLKAYFKKDETTTVTGATTFDNSLTLNNTLTITGQSTFEGITTFENAVSVRDPMDKSHAASKNYVDLIVPVLDYAEHKEFKKGQLVKYGTKVCLVPGDFTSTTWSSDEASLTLLNKDNMGMAEYANGVEIQNGQTVLYNGNLYVSKSTITATEWATDEVNMVPLSSVDLSDFYRKGETYSKAEVDTEITKKIDAAKVYTKSEADELHKEMLSKVTDKATIADLEKAKADMTTELNAAIKQGQEENGVLKTEIEAEIPALAEAAAKTVAYTKAETNAKLLTKVDITTLNDYTNTVDMTTMINKKADKTALDSYYTKTEVDTQHSTLVKDIYNKSEIAGLLSQKVDVTTLESDYTNNANLKKQLLEKADKATLDDQTTKHNNDVIKLTTAMEEVSNELTKQVTGLEELANKFTAVIPTKASATNQLTDKEYVDNAVKTAAARAISADADGSGFTSVEALKAGPWYSLGESTTPTTNDYAVVKKDATHNNNDVRYNYDGKVWAFFQEFTSGSGGSTSFTTSQQLAIDSGITAVKVTEIQTNANNIAAETTARIKGDADLAVEVEKKVKEASNLIGDLATLNTDVKTSIVECLNDLHDELHNERLATDGSNKMTGQLDIVLSGSGDLLLLKAADKGVNFNLDATTGYMNIIPESAPTTGFELSAVSIKPRTSTYPYSLGDNNNAFTNAFIKNINNTPVSSFLTTADVTKEEIAQIKTDIETNKTDIANRVLKTGDEMTGTLKVTLPGSGDLIHMEAGGKGVTFTMDASTGYMNIIPVSAPTTGFEVSAFALEPRTTDIPYRLGNEGNEWTTVWTKNINKIPTADIAVKSDLDPLKYFATNTTGSLTFTQEEYDALTEEEKNNGKMYIIVG